jgi:uncharacterized protein YdhG (YjbR/CyaY superfamily)
LQADDPHRVLFDKAEPAARERLEAIAGIVRKIVPHAQPTISYGMPAFRAGRIIIYFAAFRKHVGIYPPVAGPPELLAELEPYRGPKGNLLFPHAGSLPLALIGKVVTALNKQYGED